MEEEEDEFEIISKAELEELKKEVEDVRKNPFGDTATSKTLLESMERLNSSINKLIQIFEDANEEIIKEYQESKPAEKLNQILDQNEKIAEGVVALADLMNKPEPKEQMQIMPPMPPQFQQMPPPTQRQQKPQNFPQPNMNRTSQGMFPPPDFNNFPPLDMPPMPPPPQNPPDKKGLFFKR